MSRTNVAILGSTRGTALQTIIDEVHSKELDVNLKLVISNKINAYILERARKNEIEALYIPNEKDSRDSYDLKISNALEQHDIDLIVLIGYMRILSAKFIRHWQGKVINVHPSLLPKHAGLMDLDVHHSVLHAKEQESGCSVHFVTEEVDAGPVILQSKCPVFENDSAEDLRDRVKALEGAALISAIQLFLKERQ